MGALDGFYSTWNKARETFGVGTPTDGSQYNGSSSQLLNMKSSIESASKHDGWQGKGAEAYAAANKEHAAVYQKLADLDKKISNEVTNASEVVMNGRNKLDNAKSWVDSAVQALPPTNAQDRERKLIPIANEGINRVNTIVSTANTDMNTIAGRITGLKGEWDTLTGNQKFGPGSEKADHNGDGKPDGDEKKPNGKEDGQALADQAKLGSALRDPAVLDRVAKNLPQSPLLEEELQALADGKEVDSVPKETLDYYHDFFKAAGKDGLLMLDRHLESQEASGNGEAGSQRDRLANGLTVTSNEKIVDRNPDGSVASRGGYDQLPSDLREMLETRRSDPTYPGWDTLGPTDAKNHHVADVVQFSELMGESNPGYQPGSRLGTEMYLKSADMVGNSLGGWGMTDTPPESYERAASSLAEVAGRNDEASYRIWSGTGEGLPDGYNREETVRTLIGHDWSESGSEGNGAATLLDWITDGSNLPADNEMGERARQAFIEIPHMLAPSDTDPVWAEQRDAFARNPAIATEMSQVLAANVDALVAPGAYQGGFLETRIDETGHPQLNADDTSRLLELGGYSEQGRSTLAVAAETLRLRELGDAMSSHSGDLKDVMADSAAGSFAGSVDKAITDAVNHQNDVLKNDLEYNNPADELYRVKSIGAQVAGALTDEFVDWFPGSKALESMTGGSDAGEFAEFAMGKTDFDAGGFVENSIKDWMGMPEYQDIAVPDADLLRAASTVHAQQSVLQAAFAAGQLPSDLIVDGRPVNVESIGASSTTYERIQQFMRERGLGLYVTDFGQSYASSFNVK
ncbi:EspA/EspE family type VII secretion system effector [Mycolicibacterium porcinum]|uniref:EspA/EspE family type VII secretion system effector n=1 Tax=Mycolicibacterium porcinum TaxID=39693 RepID=A0ABV3VHF9_9MYCO